MQERGLTNYKLAKISGINRSTIGRYLDGSLKISLDNFLIIVKALGLEIKIIK
jgi:plasmid maintenance system antidote protein VapI